MYPHFEPCIQMRSASLRLFALLISRTLHSLMPWQLAIEGTSLSVYLIIQEFSSHSLQFSCTQSASLYLVNVLHRATIYPTIASAETSRIAWLFAEVCSSAGPHFLFWPYWNPVACFSTTISTSAPSLPSLSLAL